MGIDLGTSSLKVLIIDSDGSICAESSRAYQFDSPYPGYAEQDTAVWWNTCCAAIREALTKYGKPPTRIAAVSFSGQMHGLVMLDKNRLPIRPAILHCDARSEKEAEKIKAFAALFPPFNPAYTGFLLSSLLWVREHEPEQYRRIDRVCLPKDFLKLKLCGELTSDYSDASGTLAFDIVNMDWSAELLKKLELRPEWFPPCFDACYVAGKVTRAGSEDTGLADGTLVVNGGGDQIMQAIGNGAILPGQVTLNIGSSGQVCYQSEKPIQNPAYTTNTFCGYGRGSWITMGATMTAGLSLKWFNNLFDSKDYRWIDTEAGILPPGAGGLLFMPWLNGERTPYVKPDISGAFLGLSLNTGRAHMARAVMEGVAFSLYRCFEVCAALGLRGTDIIASGGGARSRVWLAILSDIFGAPLKTTIFSEQACLGAAITAFTGAGVFDSLTAACSRLVCYKPERQEPLADNHTIYQAFYRQYTDVYARIGDTLQNLNGLGKAY
jgi:xylulokinase